MITTCSRFLRLFARPSWAVGRKLAFYVSNCKSKIEFHGVAFSGTFSWRFVFIASERRLIIIKHAAVRTFIAILQLYNYLHVYAENIMPEVLHKERKHRLLFHSAFQYREASTHYINSVRKTAPTLFNRLSDDTFTTCLNTDVYKTDALNKRSFCTFYCVSRARY